MPKVKTDIGAMNFPVKFSQSLPYVLLPISCIFFDETLKISWINSSSIFRALVDNSAHAFFAFLSWLAVAGITRRGIAESVFCAVLASAIDLDHFIMAKSLKMKVNS